MVVQPDTKPTEGKDEQADDDDITLDRPVEERDRDQSTLSPIGFLQSLVVALSDAVEFFDEGIAFFYEIFNQPSWPTITLAISEFNALYFSTNASTASTSDLYMLIY